MIPDNNKYNVPTPAVVKQVGVHIDAVDGVPSWFAGENPFWGFMYTFNPSENLPYLEAIKSMYEQGVRLFSFVLPLTATWLPEGGYDFTLVDELHRKIMQVAPEGLFYPRLFLATPPWWDEKYPEELIGFRGDFPTLKEPENELENSIWKYSHKANASPHNPSLASRKWREDASEALKAYVRHTWKGDFAGHWMGYQIAHGTCGEWGSYGTFFGDRYGSFDFSRPMLASFRAFLQNKYQSDADLNSAWNDKNVTLETAEPPTKLQMHKTELGCLKQPGLGRHMADWIECYSHELYDSMIHFGRAAKEAAPVSVLTGGFGGYRFQVGCAAYISSLDQVDLDYLLESDAIDMLHTPNVYHNRLKGVFSQGAVSTIARKKVFLAENDVRTYKANDLTYGPGADVDFSLKSFKRDTFYNYVQGGGHQWWYDFGNGWYLDSDYEEIISRLVGVSRSLPPSDWSGQSDVALVTDELSLCYVEGCSNYLQICRQSLNEDMPRMGTGFDLITFDDMLQRKPYKLYIFRDMFYASEQRVQKVRKLLEDNNSSALWIYAPGSISDSEIGTAQASKLTGIKLQFLNTLTSNQVTILRFDHPVTKDVRPIIGTEGNDDFRGVYAPVVYADDPDAEVLGQIESLGVPGLAFKRNGARFDAWVASPLLPAKLFGNFAREAGAHMYVETGVALFGHSKLFSLQSSEGGIFEFTPKHPAASVTNLLVGNQYPNDSGKFQIELQKDDPILLRVE